MHARSVRSIYAGYVVDAINQKMLKKRSNVLEAAPSSPLIMCGLSQMILMLAASSP
jgi:hypothetical protein